MATIKQIALLAGVSRGTVDRVLNNRGVVNGRTATRVLEIAKSLDYKPNRAGRALAAQKKKLKLGVVLMGESNSFFHDVMLGINSKAKELMEFGCTVLTRNVQLSEQSQVEAIDELVKQGIHGLVIAPYNHPDVIAKINEISDKGIAVVTTNTDVSGSKRIAYVGSNYLLSGSTAAGLMSMVTGGNAIVGIVTGSLNVLCHTQRIAGFESVIEKSYKGIRIAQTVENNDDDLESYEVTKNLLSRHKGIDAIYCTAAGVYGTCKAVSESGRAEKIKIICHDAVPTTRRLLKEGIIAATICQQPKKQGSKPLEILFNYLVSGVEPKAEINYTELDIRIRENI